MPVMLTFASAGPQAGASVTVPWCHGAVALMGVVPCPTSLPPLPPPPPHSPRTHLYPGRYIIKNGIVGFLGRIVSYGQYFGEDMLLNETYRRFYSATALSYVDLYVLDRAEFSSIMEQGTYPRIKVRGSGYKCNGQGRGVLSSSTPDWMQVV